ncbi:MAG: hypothetical protein QOJ22_414 [Thermoleophilaceae bacterium]|jgi:hypothetical protein|nr:hypothetical protein [Thermoleophilaceae bacterium]
MRAQRATASAVCVLALSAAAAVAQDEPTVGSYDELQSLPEDNSTLDSVIQTKRRDGSSVWVQVDGARFRDAGKDTAELTVEEGGTTYADNLFKVAFRNDRHGFAGGERCDDPDPDLWRKDEIAEAGCRPVLFEYTDTRSAGSGEASWTEVALPGGDQPGFVGGIAWIDVGRAMVVGGTGLYPRREPSYNPDCQDLDEDRLAPWGAECDPAGMARVWLYDRARDQQWCELKVGEASPGCPALPDDDPATAWFDGMRGLTAVDFKPDGFRVKNEPEVGFVGGLGQMWRWQKTTDPNAKEPFEGFDERIDARSLARTFRFRVRDLRFVQQAAPVAFAVTSGCCTPYRDPRGTTDSPATLTYNGYGWTIAGGSDPNQAEDNVNDAGLDPGQRAIPGWAAPASPIASEPSKSTWDSTWSTPWPDQAPPVDSLRERGTPVPDVPSTKLTPYQGLGEKADSYYALVVHKPGAHPGPMTPLLTPGGERDDNWAEGRNRWLSIAGSVSICPGGCWTLEWKVGELRTPEAASSSRQGLVQSTLWANPPAHNDKYPTTTYCTPNPLNGRCLNEQQGPEVVETTRQLATGDYVLTDEARLRGSRAGLEGLVSSYTLNWIDMVDLQGKPTGQAWAVGDHGAILRLDAGGAEKAAGTRGEPAPPTLSGGDADLSPPGAFDSVRPVGAARPGQVPALASRPLEQLTAPRIVSMGSPDATHAGADCQLTGSNFYCSGLEDVGQIVMSRDGSEGWAIGPNPPMHPAAGGGTSAYGRASLYHYDGAEWRRCDPKGLPGVSQPDPACAGLVPLIDSPSRGRLVAAARIPYENDGPGEPENDDDFELLAITSGFDMARFKDGRWGIDDGLRGQLTDLLKASSINAVPALLDLAFTAPDDGWALARQGAGGAVAAYWLFHWDGKRWSLCGGGSSCGSARIPVQAKVTRAGDGSVERNAGEIVGLEAAGDRVYLFGWRVAADINEGLTGTFRVGQTETYLPLILYHDREETGWTDGSGEGEDGGGWDPGWPPSEQALTQKGQGKVVALSVVERPGGGYRGWAIGRFYDWALPADRGSREHPGYSDQYQQGGSSDFEPSAIALRLDQKDGKGSWGYFKDPGALNDFMKPGLKFEGTTNYNYRLETEPHLMASSADGRAWIAQRKSGILFGFEPDRERFDVIQSQRPGSEPPRGVTTSTYPVEVNGVYQALAPDGQGGFWAAVKNTYEDDQRAGAAGGTWETGGQVFFYHYTDRPHRPVFREVPQPLGGGPERLTTLAGAADGSVWAGTDAGRVARYDRMTGWETLAIPGWEPGEVVTKRSEVNAVAVNDSGVGIAVGPGGRVADLSRDAVRLNPAAGKRCDDETGPPCGAGHDLRAAAVAPDGSAIAVGNALTVLWRPAGGDFRRLIKPGGDPREDKLIAVSLPRPDRAYLISTSGIIYAGRPSGDGWSWAVDNADADGELEVPKDAKGDELMLRAIAIDEDGHGYAVGDKGLVLERSGEGAWTRVHGPGTDTLGAITLSRYGDAALVGGRNGVIWSVVGDRFEIARPGDYAPQAQAAGSPLMGPIVGLALLPGVEDGQVEAWAASEGWGTGTNRLLHYTSDPDEPLLDSTNRAEPLPDVPAARDGELAFAAFGNTDCDTRQICMARRGTLSRHEVIGERLVEELRDRFAAPGSGFALFTGDATYTAGMPASATIRSDRAGSVEPNSTPFSPKVNPYGTPEGAIAPVAQRQWNRAIADPLERGGLAVLGTVGPGDLSRPLYNCSENGNLNFGGSGCGAVADDARAGDNLSWRAAMGARRAPWGKTPAVAADGGLSFDPVEGSDLGAQEVPEQRVDPDGPSGPLSEYTVGGGARTHYAVDVKRDGQPVARIVVVDTSLRSLQGSDPMQQPAEPDGQLQWLERMICRQGETATGGGTCTRGQDQEAIVLTSTPTYSYGTTSPNEINATDGIQLEALLLKHEASVVVSGRLGWNTRYWATAPGVHCPTPGGAYQDSPPSGAGGCGGEAAGGLPAGATGAAQALQALGAPAPPELPEQVSDQTKQTVEDTTGVLPFVIAGGGGGPFGTSDAEASQQSASRGYWNGYTVVRLDPSGDPVGTIVEQRPVFDWVNLTAQTHVLRPGQTMTLRGVGREPIGYGAKVTTRFDQLNTTAISHRYDLVMADPEKPYLPLEDANGDYVPVPAQVATVDRTTGAVRAGRGPGERTYAIAILSVGDKAATWPIAFEPRRSFTAERVKLTLPALPRAARAPAAQQPIRPGEAPPPLAPPPAAAPGSPLSSQSLQPPPPPELPSLPTINAAGPPPAPSLSAPPPPPPPPAPPPVPPQQQPLPLSLGAKLQAVAIVPSVNPPAPPPVNPAPPGGAAARKEAKQKQAAVAKSEEQQSVGAETQGLGGDQADAPLSPQGSQMTRHQPLEATRRAADRPTASFSPIVRPDPASAWSRGALYGGGLGLATLALVLGFSVLRPRPRRRPPEVPAPAWNRVRRG